MADEITIIKRVRLQPHHLRPGRTKHTLHDELGIREFPGFVALEIGHSRSDNCYYLFHLTESGIGTDTWHPSLQEALEQAEFEFNVRPEEWMDSSTTSDEKT